MRAIILAAGMGNRLEGELGQKPKALLSFGGRSLLRRHIELLRRIGVPEAVVAIGYRADLIAAELAALGADPNVRTVMNPDYSEGSVVTLWTVRKELSAGEDVLLMDADVLYDRRILERLRDTRHANCFLLDRNLEPGEEPMKLAVKDGVLVEFSRRVHVPFDYCGESVGFFRLSPEIADALTSAARRLIEAGRRKEGYEEALRQVLLAAPPRTFGFEDVTDVPWIEIDFREDVHRARKVILPQLL